MPRITADKMETAEAMVASMIKTLGPMYFVAAVNNACAHGKAFIDAGYKLDDDDKMLKEFFNGIGIMQKAAKDIEKFTRQSKN